MGRRPRQVLVVGGGVGALEFVLALHDLAGSLAHVTLVASRPTFGLRALSVLAPFGHRTPPALSLAEVLEAHDGVFWHDSVVSVDAERGRVTCEGGEDLAYDSLVLAPGAKAECAFSDRLTVDAGRPCAVSEVVEDLCRGRARSVAFVVPDGATWSLPLYELALMTAERLARSAASTPRQDRPCRGQAPVALGAGVELAVERVVALPRLKGPGIAGTRTDADGFIVTDAEGHATGLLNAWAIGDATQQPIKQGGLACQQADGVAARIASACGARVAIGPPALVLRGRLITGARDRFLTRAIGASTGESAATPHRHRFGEHTRTGGCEMCSPCCQRWSTGTSGRSCSRARCCQARRSRCPGRVRSRRGR